jgi:phosphopantothenoylcysteine decarboxylase/phosphopantothenate--cysteine ligase
MASLTVRKLAEAVKDGLRLRAARHGRSVEDEVRSILREAAAGREAGGAPEGHTQSPAPPPWHAADASRRPPPVARGERRVLLVIGAGIAAYKSLDLIRRLRERGMHVRCVLTRAAQHFVTPLSVGALADEPCHIDLFDPRSEFDAGHIRIARDCDLVVVAPATADLMAKIANGHADDLATAVLLATDRPVLLAPAMNPLMWLNDATQRNVARLKQDGRRLIGPNSGEMAESGEAGLGRMAEPLEIVDAVQSLLRPKSAGALAGMRVLITSGPTHEPIDPVRYIANRSSGKQGFAIAAAAAAAGADVTLVSGPVGLGDPPGVNVRRIETAAEMMAAVEAALPADVAIFAAAVADWRVAAAGEQKLKKTAGGPPSLALVENPDILAAVSRMSVNRPPLVIGFAAETEHVIAHAQAKLARKRCDWILANDVSPESGVMGGDRNTIHLVRDDAVEAWPRMSKNEVADTLVARIAAWRNSRTT